MNHKEIAREYFTSGYNCAQAVFCAFSDVTGIDHETSCLLASSFGGGMGRMREVCGTCTSMFMIAGLLYGYMPGPDIFAKSEHYALVQHLAGKFKEKHGTINCKELLASLKPDCTPNASPRTKEYYKVRPCVKFVESAAEIIDEYINSHKPKEG